MKANDPLHEVRNIWSECFHDSPEWMEMYFSKVCNAEDALILTENNIAVSSMMLIRYSMNFHGKTIPVGYIAGAATRRRYRGQGNMSRLMKTALHRAYGRGDILVTLIPASRRLYFYYDRFGFATVFYVDEERYTALHSFAYEGDYSLCENMLDDDIYEAFNLMTLARNCSIIHTRQDYENIIDDTIIDGGTAIALRDNVSGKVAATAWGALNDGRLVIRELTAVSDDARQAAMAEMQRRYPNMPITLTAPPDNRRIPIHARGMARIVNATRLLENYAAVYPDLSMAIRIYDPLIAENCHTYIIDRGSAVINDGFGGKIDIDVTVEVLTSILFSQQQIGEIFNMPTARPYISLMMD